MRMCHQALVFAPPTGAPTRPREPASVEDSAAQAADDRSTPGAGSPATAPFSFTAVAADTLQQPLVGAVPVDAMEGLRIQHISAMDLYADRQPEELRWHDYSVSPPSPRPPRRATTHIGNDNQSTVDPQRLGQFNPRWGTVSAHIIRVTMTAALSDPAGPAVPAGSSGNVGVAGAAAAAGGVPRAGHAVPCSLARLPPGGSGGRRHGGGGAAQAPPVLRSRPAAGGVPPARCGAAALRAQPPPLQNPSPPLRHDIQHVSTLLALSLQHTCFVSQTRAFLTRPAVKDAVKGLCRVSLYFFISFLSFVFSARHFLYTILGFGCEASVGQIGLD